MFLPIQIVSPEVEMLGLGRGGKGRIPSQQTIRRLFRDTFGSDMLPMIMSRSD